MRVPRSSAVRLSAFAAAVACALVATGARAQDAVFDIDAYDVSGNTLLQPVAVEAAVYPHMGPGKDAASVEAARAALEAAYQAAGYQTVIVEIPEQAVSDRVIRLAVTETSVGRLRVTGSRYFSLDDIKARAPSLAEGSVPNLRQAEKELADLNRQPDRQIAPVLRPGRIPGTVDVDLAVTDSLPLHGSFEVNNDHSPFTSDTRVNATLRYTNLFQRGHTAFVGYTVAPERRGDTEVFQGSYLIPLQGTPWSFQISGYDSNSNVSTIGGTNILGLGYQVNLRAQRELPAFENGAHRVSFGLDYNDFSLETLVFPSDGGPPEIVEFIPTTYVPLIASYSVNRDTGTSTTTATLAAAASLRGVGDDETEFRENRFLARANFVKLNLDVDHVQTLPGQFVAALRFIGQVADGPLIPREQFAIGGLATVRGYLQSSSLGDNGALGSLELRSPLLAPQLAPFVDDLRVYAFGDVGHVRIIDPLPEQDSRSTLVSLGIGTRFQIYSRLSGDLLLGVPLEDGPEVESGQAYGYFTLRTEF